MPAVLLGGSVTALAAARSLGAAGVAVTVLGDGLHDFVVRRSRHCRRYEHFPSAVPTPPADRWLDWLVGQAEPSVVLPCGDDGLELIARRRSAIEAAGHRAVEADDGVLLEMLDKPTTYRKAAELGLDVPRTVEVTSLAEAEAAVGDGIGWPCAVKPAQPAALDFTVPGYRTPKGTTVHDRAGLVAAVAPLVEAGIAVLVTEFADGPDDGFCSYYSYLDQDGNPLFHFTKRKLRQYPPRFGTGTYHETRWQPDVAEAGLRLFQGVGLRGVGNVEFKRRPDGRLTLIECNARFTLATGQVRRAGIDLPLLAYNRLAGLPLPPLASFADGVRLWSPRLDLRAFRQYRAEGELDARRYLASLLHPQHFPVFAWDDPLPSLAALRGRLRR